MAGAGWLITALAVMLGAPFWFDVLNKFMVIRSTVKPREKSQEEGSEHSEPTCASNAAAGGRGTASGPGGSQGVAWQGRVAGAAMRCARLPPTSAGPGDKSGDDTRGARCPRSSGRRGSRPRRHCARSLEVSARHFRLFCNTLARAAKHQ